MLNKYLSGYIIVVAPSLLLDSNALGIFNSIRNEIIQNYPLHISDETYNKVKSNKGAIDILSHFSKDGKLRPFVGSDSRFINNSIASNKTVLLCNETQINSLDESIDKIKSNLFYICYFKEVNNIFERVYLKSSDNLDSNNPAPPVGGNELPKKSHSKKFKPSSSFNDNDVIKKGSLMNLSRTASEGDILDMLVKKKKISLKNEIGRGAEGVIFDTNYNDRICKVYFKDKLTTDRIDKLKLMVINSRMVKHSAICWPLDVVAINGVGCGYIMKRATGNPLSSVLNYRSLKRNYAKWTRKELVGIAKNEIEIIKFLHSREIIVGDIHLDNIFIDDSTKRVFFIDTDSYQIENYVSPVGMPDFIAPEIQGKHLNFLRTKEHELFAVAILIFKTLIPGQHPYSRVGGNENTPTTHQGIVDGVFPYPFKNNPENGVPPGKWIRLWSELPDYIKMLFFKSFYRDHNMRHSLDDWSSAITKYLNDLNDGNAEKAIFFN